jgi:hypothetical protein
MHSSRRKIPIEKISSGSVLWRDLIQALKRVNGVSQQFAASIF